MPQRPSFADEQPQDPRAEAARAIAARILTETGDRPADDPERLILLAAAVEQAPAETRPVLEAIRANWTWGYFQANRWRFAQRTSGGVVATDLAAINAWDLPTIVGEIRGRFAAALAAGDELKKLPVGAWTAILSKGTMPDAYRPTVFDVVAHDAVAFATSGERGLADPEDAFELEATSPALGTPAEFCGWRPEATATDTDSPLVQAAMLFRDLLDVHAADKDQTAFLAADFERILWAAGNAVDSGEVTVTDRKAEALEAFIERAGDHEVAAQARHALAELARGANDLVEARAIAAQGVEQHPASAGGRLCSNLITEIESRELSLATERAWAAPWPAVRVTYRNIAKVHLRLAKADWQARLDAGKPHPGWLDDADREAILALPAVTTFVADLPATADYQSRSHDITVAAAFDPQGLEPGPYWVIASHAADFNATDNVVQATLVWVSRLAVVSGQRQPSPSGPQPLAGHVVDIATGEPVAGATVTTWVREDRGSPPAFVGKAAATTDQDGRYEIPGEQGKELLIVASAMLDGVAHRIPTDSTHDWQPATDDRVTTIVLVTDRGIHRPGQLVFYKGIACSVDRAARGTKPLAKRAVTITLRDANGREVAKVEHETNAFGSFHGTLPIAAAALPGQWMLAAETAGFSGGVGVRVEEYKRPKYQVELQAPAEAVKLGAAVVIPGKATTYTGLAVGGAKVSWRVERQARMPLWCRWLFSWLPFDDSSRKIARGTEVTDADGGFTIRFPAVPDRSLPKEALPVFTYRVVADVTDAGGETRSAARSVAAGYTEVQATVTAGDWHAIAADVLDAQGRPAAAVALSLATTSLDGDPRAATGTFTIHPLVQPAEVVRGTLLDEIPPARPVPFGRARRARAAGNPGGRPRPTPDPADPNGWADAAAVVSREVSTEAATGTAEVATNLPAGIYRAVFVIPAQGDVPEVRGQTVFEVLDPAAQRYSVKRGFTMQAARAMVEPGEAFSAVVGTGYDRGRVLVEISQAGATLSRFWTAAGRTQWPVTFTPGDANRGGFTVTAWMVRDGRLYREQKTIDVPWTDKKLVIAWERFTRRVEPAAKEVWRARITTAADPLTGPAVPAVAEMLAVLYDQSLDALAEHQWPADGLLGLFRRESEALGVGFTNAAERFNGIHGTWQTVFEGVEITYRELRDPFGPPGGRWDGGAWGGVRVDGLAFMRTRRAATRMEMDGAMPMAAAPAEESLGDRKFKGSAARPGDQPTASIGGVGQDVGAADQPAVAPSPRRNLAETAFFLPTLVSGSDGSVTIEYTLPDTLTTWQFKGLAHDAALRSGTIIDQCVASKDLMVEPLMPRFFREGDTVEIPVKVSNTSSGRLAGTVRFELADARTGDSRNDLVDGPREQPFDIAAGETQPVVFTVKVADGTDTLRYTATGSATGSARLAADGEEAVVPVLPRRVLVTETVPITIRGPGQRRVAIPRLLEAAGTEIRSQSLVVQAASNPAWYGVLALPSLMEESDECIESLFTRLYANAYARHIATADPRIERVFAQWKGTDALESPLEKNADLMKTLLAETPWVRDAVDERESRARMAVLFDATRAENEMQTAVTRLETLRNGDGGWPWFPGGQSCDPVTLSIIAGFGRLRANGVAIDVQPALAALPWLDARLIKEQQRATGIDDPVLTPFGAFALYARSFFVEDEAPDAPATAAIRWGLDLGKTTWMKLDARRSQGHLALALHRAGDRETARSILDSLKQRAVNIDAPQAGADQHQGEHGHQDAWQGMWWRDRHPTWWSWASAPIETQSIMIEAFDEVAGDADAVEALKAWLLSQKRTSRWPGTVATADAVGALFGRGRDLLASQELVTVTVGGQQVEPARVEAGTGFFEERFVRREITPAMGEVVMTKPGKGFAWGGVHWQYLDAIDNVPAAGRAELAIDKQLFVKRLTKAGPVLEPAREDGTTQVNVGDELVVRLVVTSDRDYEFLELADHRPSLTEPVDVLSGWRWADGAGWYLAIRDASTQFFFERLPRGTHVFEYSLRTAHRGKASSGFATLRSRYAPEFSAHSASIPVEVK
ncbi:MAG: alpha-2-macroglobulin family protein [Pirellulales bacterium]